LETIMNRTSRTGLLDRRRFLGTAAAAGLAPALRSQTAEAHVEILLDEPIATIAPEIYSHFVEHLGTVVYGGIWVGEDSKIANIGGIRKELVEKLRKVRPAVMRWPGGCFADQYDWRDGVGPRAKRPRRTNYWVDAREWPANASKSGPQRYDPNHFGTIEFARFCRLAGAQPYFAANLRSLPAQEFWRWVEYCNSPAGSTTLADQRASDGERQPLNVRFWGVGNESWGCGGEFTPEDYASEYRRYSAWVPRYGVDLALVGSGPNGDARDWTRRFFEKLTTRGRGVGSLWGWALHHYSWNSSGGRKTDWYTAKGDALNFDAEQYHEILREAGRTEPLILSHWDLMREFDPAHKVRLVVDEWGAWYLSGTEPTPESLLGQQNTMRDAVLAGLTLDIFNRHADKVGMANIAQLVNNLQALFLVSEDRFTLTPTYHVFDMYSAHQGATSVRAEFASPEVRYRRNGQPATIRGLNGSASLAGKRLTITVSNPHLTQACAAEIAVRGGAVKSASGVVLAAADVHAHNTWDNPRAVEPQPANVSAKGRVITHTFPPASVTKLTIELA
jgi:alpha-L-arabinofuranosidase